MQEAHKTKEEEEMLLNWDKIRQKLMEKAGLTQQQMDAVGEVLTHILEVVGIEIKEKVMEGATEGANEATRLAVDAAEVAANKKWEEDRCRRSILVNNADKWASHINNSFSLAENTTAQIHRLTGHATLVLDAFAVGQVDKEPTSIFVTFGSVAHKATFFRVMAKTIAERRTRWERISGISCRDAFPKEKMAEAKRITEKGFILRRSGRVAAF